MPVAVIDGPYDAAALARVLSHSPVDLGPGRCGVVANRACDHGTFIMGLLGARRDATIPGLCPDCRLLHVPLFAGEQEPSASIDTLADAITRAVAAGARIVNLSLAILGDDEQPDPGLAAALDHAQASGALVVAAAGNQGRLAVGQILAHPVTIPVVATDAAGRLLPECNFGPVVSRRGVAALGHEVPGYAPGLGTAVMSGTSVAAAVAAAIIADVWSARPDVSAEQLRMAVARLTPRALSAPPQLDRDVLLNVLDRMPGSAGSMPSPPVRSRANHASLQGEIMNVGHGLHASPNQTPTPSHVPIAIPAGGTCACGASGGLCTCGNDQDRRSSFVYAIGTVEAECPNLAIEREMQALARHFGIEEPDTDMPVRLTEDRHWQHAVLSHNDKKDARYLARQLSWRLTIEDYPAFVLSPRDPADFDDLVDCLERPKFPRREGGKGKKGSKPDFDHPLDLDVIIGVTGSQTPNGIEVKMDQVFQIAPNRLIPPGADYFQQLADNHGLTDEDRAYNYLIARYAIEPATLNAINRDFELAGVPALYSRLGGDNRRIVRVIYTFNSKGPDAPAQRKFFVRVDVTDEFPFMVTSWNRYLERGEQS